MTRKILVVEDDGSIRENLREMLEAEDFSVLDAADGAEGLRVALEIAPDLVVCDVNMPGLDGFQVLKGLRENPATVHIPLLFLTARADRTSLRRGMEMGAEDYLTKPFSRQELLAAVHSRLSRAESLAATYRKQLGNLRNTLARALPHEILTPLNGILGLSAILMEEFETVRRAEMLDIARGITHSGETLHQLMRRFLGYAELEMALLDPTLRERLARTRCPDAPSVCGRALGRTTFSVEGDPSIVPDHLELLVRELAEQAGPFSDCRIGTDSDRWFLRLSPGDAPRKVPAGPQDGSDMSRALVSAACTVYQIELRAEPDGSRILSIPLWSERILP